MVTEWAEWSEADAATAWDTTLTTLSNYNLYQSFRWGEYKRRNGWVVRRGSILVDQAHAAMAQCLIREYRATRTVVVWVPGGPAGNPTGGLKLGELLQRHYYSGWYFFLRVNILEEAQDPIQVGMVSEKWVPAHTRVGHPFTFYLDLRHDAATRREALTGNWRHNLKRGEHRGGVVQVWEPGQPLGPVYAVYQEACRIQGIVKSIDLADLQAMRDALGAAFKLVVTLGEHDSPCAIRGFGQIGTRAHDLIAGVSEAGRKRYANYALVWRLLDLAREQGVQQYDLSGADSEGATGVFHFKKGLGGRLVLLMGEWDWADPAWLRRAVNLAIRFRGARL